jgi:hypothetical protein
MLMSRSCHHLWEISAAFRVGNCMLIAKPRGQGQAPFDVPSILDFNDFGDVASYRDHAMNAAHALLRFGATQNQEIDVAVHNFADAAIPSVRASPVPRPHPAHCSISASAHTIRFTTL